MYQDLPIQDIYAREILDSRGNPVLSQKSTNYRRIIGNTNFQQGG